MRKEQRVNLFIIGEAKTGTHALFSMLSQHPEVCRCKFKEPLYFCTDLWEASDLFHKDHGYFVKDYYPCRTLEQYHELFSCRSNQKIVFEASTRYAYSRVAAENIAQYNPKAKILYLVRDPVDFVHSYHSEALVSGTEIPDFKTALRLESKRKKGIDVPRRVANPSELFYSERIKYAEHLQRYLDVFPKQQIKVVVFDDLIEDNLGTFKEIARWLKIDASFLPVVRTEHSNRVPKIPWMFHAMNSPYLWKLPKSVLPEPVYEPIAIFIRRFLAKFLLIQRPRKPLASSFRDELKKKYVLEVRKISALIGRDLTAEWGYEVD